jgi:uncharacterized RDD family membrane protein YckC
MSEALQVATPERVSMELPIAGIGSRAMAYLVDLLLLGAAALILYFVGSFFVSDPLGLVQGLSTVVRIVAISVLLSGLWVFWTAFEVAWNGQSPGKRLVRIRVVKADGSPTTLFSSAVRNLLRLIDFMPLCYPVGLITMLIDRQHRRLGDLLAGTVLVRDEKVNLDAYTKLETQSSVAVNVLEVGAQFLRRFDDLEPVARARIGRKLAARLELTPGETATDVEVRELIRAKLEKPGHG